MVEPNIEHYGCVVDLLSQGGFLDGAQRLNKSMPMKPNDVVWDAFLRLPPVQLGISWQCLKKTKL